MDERKPRIAAVVSLAPILFGAGFAIYAFKVGAVTRLTLTDQAVETKETLVESAGDGGAIFALAPLVAGSFVAVLLYLARKDSDMAPVWMAWAFTGLIGILSLIAISKLGPFFFIPTLLMLLATGLTQSVVKDRTT
jgi:hypothetical protein